VLRSPHNIAGFNPIPPRALPRTSSQCPAPSVLLSSPIKLSSSKSPSLPLLVLLPLAITTATTTTTGEIASVRTHNRLPIRSVVNSLLAVSESTPHILNNTSTNKRSVQSRRRTAEPKTPRRQLLKRLMSLSSMPVSLSMRLGRSRSGVGMDRRKSLSSRSKVRCHFLSLGHISPSRIHMLYRRAHLAPALRRQRYVTPPDSPGKVKALSPPE